MAKIKFKGEDGIFSKIGKRNLLILSAVLLIGGAVVLNYFLFTGDNKVDYDGSGMTDAQPESEGTGTGDTYFSAALLSRDQARDEALAVLQTVLENEDALEETKTQALSDDTILTNGSGAYGVTIAEHMIMVTLMMLRRYPEYYEFVQTRDGRAHV